MRRGDGRTSAGTIRGRRGAGAATNRAQQDPATEHAARSLQHEGSGVSLCHERRGMLGMFGAGRWGGVTPRPLQYESHLRGLSEK